MNDAGDGDRPLIWSFDRATEIAAVDSNVKRMDYRQLCYRVVDAVLEIRQSGIVRPEHLQAFADTLMCRNEYVANHGGRRLMQCSEFSEEARSLALRMMECRNWRVRFNMVWVAAYSGRDKKLVEDVFRKALDDRSKQVREKVLDDIVGTRFTEMLPHLRRRLAEETTPAYRETLRRTIDLLDGKTVTIHGAHWRLVEHGNSWTMSPVNDD